MPTQSEGGPRPVGGTGEEGLLLLSQEPLAGVRGRGTWAVRACDSAPCSASVTASRLQLAPLQGSERRKLKPQLLFCRKELASSYSGAINTSSPAWEGSPRGVGA